MSPQLVKLVAYAGQNAEKLKNSSKQYTGNWVFCSTCRHTGKHMDNRAIWIYQKSKRF